MLSILSSSSIHSLIPIFPCSISSSSLIVSSVVLLLSGQFFFHWLPFYLFQFFSNLLQYSWSYLLSIYPNNFFAINLSGNSPLLNVSSFLFCFLISSISCLYSFLNFSIASLAFPKFSLSFQVSNSTVNPFHCTKYLSFPLTFCLFNILSTFYSSSSSIITGASCSFLCPSTCPT